MSEISEDDLRKSAKDLAILVSAQANYVNKVWLVLMAASAAIAFPTPIDCKMVKLPFSFGEADKATYDLVMFFIQSALIVAYCQAFIKAHQANGFAQKNLKGLKAREFFEFYRVDMIARPWLLIASLKNEDTPLSGPQRWRKIVSYFSIRYFMLCVQFGLPLWALCVVTRRILRNGAPYLLLVLGFFAILLVACAALKAASEEYDFFKRVKRELV
jgi:hypothetical protein